MRTESSIKTFIRIRPPASTCIFRDQKDQGTLSCCDRLYKFTHVFTPDATDTEIFERIGFQLIQNTLNGLNSTLFAYGQTGTGKTYTMTGNATREGLVQRCVALLIRKLRNDDRFQFFSLRMSYIEIYNESVRDLFAEREGKVAIREQAKSGFYLEGLEPVQICDEEGFCRDLRRGLLRRSTKSTKMNEVSSRSHTVMTIYLEVKIPDDEKGCLIRDSKLNFVDLAGSEKQKQTEATGSKLKEASSINKSLTTLSLVISKLAEKQTKASHIPYRESVLTKILKDSIGGNSMTTFIGMISSQKAWVSETISTLLFLERLKNVKNVVQINEKIQGKEEELIKKIRIQQEKIGQLQDRIQKMSKQYEECKTKLEQSQILTKQLQEERFISSTGINFFPPFGAELDYNQINYDQEETGFRFEIPKKHVEFIAPSQEEKLSTINQQGQDSEKSRFQTEVKPKTARRQQQRRSLRKNMKNAKSLLQMQNQFLRQEIRKYAEEDAQYASFIDMISSNMSNFQFAAAQILIMQAQAERLKRTEAHLESYRYKFAQLVEKSEKEQAHMKAQFLEVQSLSMEGLSRKSTILSNQCKLRQQLESVKSKETEANERYSALEESFKIQLFKLQQTITLMQETQNKGQEEIQLLRDENSRLSEIIKLYKTQSKSGESTSNCEDKDDGSQSTTFEQIQEQNLRLREKIQELEGIIQKDFMLTIAELEQQIKFKEEMSYSILNQNEFLKKNIATMEAQLQHFHLRCIQNEAEITRLLQEAQVPQEEPICYIKNTPVTFEQLIEKYQSACQENEESKRIIQSMKEEQNLLKEQIKLEKDLLKNEQESHRQAQTYFRYQLKVKCAEVSKLKQEQRQFIQAYEEQAKLKVENKQIIEHLQNKIWELSTKVSTLQNVQAENKIISGRLVLAENQLEETKRRTQHQLEKAGQSYSQELSRLAKVINDVTEVKNSLQNQLLVEKNNFQECLRSFIKVNELYRSEECCFYRYKDQYRRQLADLQEAKRKLEEEKRRLISRLAISV